MNQPTVIGPQCKINLCVRVCNITCFAPGMLYLHVDAFQLCSGQIVVVGLPLVGKQGLFHIISPRKRSKHVCITK